MNGGKYVVNDWENEIEKKRELESSSVTVRCNQRCAQLAAPKASSVEQRCANGAARSTASRQRGDVKE